MSRNANRKKGTRRGISFKILVAVPFCIAIVLQTLICFGVMIRSDTITKMEADAFDLFAERVTSHAGLLENDMVFRWSDFGIVAEAVAADVDRALADYDTAAADLAPGNEAAASALDAATEQLIDFSRRAEVDGVYLVLNNKNGEAPGNSPGSAGGARSDTAAAVEGGGKNALAALYVRDSNPKKDVENRSDLLLSVCPLSVGKQLGIALDTNWSAAFPLAPEGDPQSDFFYQPLRAAEAHPQASTSDLGYWGRPVDLGWAGTSSITYSMPIRDAKGEVVGVFGVEVRLDRLTDFIPYRDLDENGVGSYLIAITTEDGGFTRADGAAPTQDKPRTYEVIASTGATQSLYVEDGLLTAEAALYDGFNALPIADNVDNIGAVAVSEIELYDSTSPFAGDHWAVVGIEPINSLFSSSFALERNLLGVFGASFVIGIVIAALIAWLSSSRLRHLLAEVRAARPEQPIAFTPTGVTEIDELSDSIQELGTEVAHSASRLSQILKLSDRTIGAFEVNAETDMVTSTDSFFTTLALLGHPSLAVEERLANLRGAAVSRDAFRQLLNAFRPYMEEEAPGRYLISDQARTRWARLVVMESDGHQRTFGLIEDVTNEIETRRRIEHERDHDILTGLLNRRAFEHLVTQRLEKDPPAIAAMVMLDLDNLKYINDTYGHDWGDHYIKVAGQAVAISFRGSAQVSRISGDEFLVFIDGCESRSTIDALLESFRSALDTSELEAPDGKPLKVRASTGVAYYPDDARDFAHLREYADFAMYMAKNSRRGDLFSFERESYDEKSFILNSKEDLNRLLEENLVTYFFQPIVDVRAGEVAAYEALMRPQVASIPTPDRVLALARSQSQLYRVERLTFFGALAAYASLPIAGKTTLFVNSVATQRLSADDECELMERYEPLLKHLVIEITESDYSREMALYKEALANRFGARLAIDDFGSGYNGETSLLDYRADFVKIDMSIVRGIDTMRDRRDIARNLIEYAHERGINVVAEGVETAEELRTVIELGTDYVQGYLLGRPAAEPADVSEDVKRLIRSLGQ